MAIKLNFTCEFEKKTSLHVESIKLMEQICIRIFKDAKLIESIYLDKSTAIKFAKTLRTEINKIES